MLKTYTKIILGIITFFGTLFGPFSVVIQPAAQQADTNIPTIGFVHNITYAVDPVAPTTVTPTNADLAVTLESFLKVIYVLLWPALFIAGLAMDNSLVYGEIFGLDNALFKFWQIMKNFANFALGFIFVWSILKYIFDMKGGKATNPKDIITKLLLGAIGVNTSWFIIGALVDISTALTVGIGGLPLQLIGDQAMAQKPIFGSITSIKLNNAIGQKDNAAILHTRPGSQFSKDGKYFLPCYIEDSRIVWDDNKRQTAFGISNGQGSVTGTNVGRTSIVKDYCVARGNGIHKDAYVKASSPVVSDGAAMKIVYTDSFAAINKAGNCSTNNVCQTLDSFTKKTEGYQGAFYSLYASLLNLSTIHIGVPKSNVSLGMEMLMKMIIALAYLIPLMILAIVLIMRVGYLWLIIAFSPFIVLASIKELGGGMKGGIKDETLKKVFDINNVISLLLLPVIVTFVISLSIVFLSSLSEGLTKNGSAESMGIYQRTEGTYKCYDVAITSICLDMPGTDIGTGIFDYFSWMIMNLFGIGLMWFAVMAALKSSEFTAKVAGTIETLGKDMIMSANFIPIPGGKEGERTSLSALKELPRNIENQLGNSKAQGSQILAQTMEGVGRDLIGGDKKVNTAITNTTKSLNAISQTPSTTAFAAQKSQFIKDINTGSFAAGKNMSFGQADNAAAFANMLAEKGGFTQRFTRGQDLFTTESGQQVLAKWVDGSGPGTWDKLKDMYGNGVKATDWEDQESGIRKYVTNTVIKEEIVLKDKKTDKKLYKKGDELIVGDEETGNNVFEQEEFKTVIADINTLLKDEKYKDIKIGGEFTVNAKKYRLQKGKDNKVTPEEIVNTPTENKTPQEDSNNITTKAQNPPSDNTINTDTKTNQPTTGTTPTENKTPPKEDSKNTTTKTQNPPSDNTTNPDTKTNKPTTGTTPTSTK